ncbi:MAG: endonuclease MutS2 [Clostridia bacterium]|nr:endonuclease MutS2 [Clostridia bacterium]
MISNKTLKQLEYDKILEKLNSFAVLDGTKNLIKELLPISSYAVVKHLLDKTQEGFCLLYNEGVGVVEYFTALLDEPERAMRGGVLNFQELLKCARLLRASRITKNSIVSATTNAPILKEIANKIYVENYLENSIFSKILSETQMADTASDKLYSIRQSIKEITEKIRIKLNDYMRKDANKFMQDNVVSKRFDRYVIPVKSEYVTKVKGLIHDRSQSGNTFFIEPQEILDLNNELRNAVISENQEIERILQELSSAIGLISNRLYENETYLCDIDLTFCKAQYAYQTKSIYPNLNSNGIINIKTGRHPLIDAKKAVPVSVSVGENYNYVLISGPNTGGKTVTLKLVGLLTLMAMTGLFVPCEEESSLSTFDSVCADIGDEQSIEQNLSTFSSHLKNIIDILQIANKNSLVLIDELGAGTDPDEGSAIALAVLTALLNKDSIGLVTTHFNSLKEFAYSNSKVLNASMDFDSSTFAPLYKLRTGLAGTSNAIEIAVRLGLNKEIANLATSFLTSEKISFNNMLKEAEIVKERAEKEASEIKSLKEEQVKLLNKLNLEKDKFYKEKEKFLLKAKIEAKKAFSSKLEEAEDMLLEMKDIFNKDEYVNSDLVKMATLKNKISSLQFNLDEQNSSLNNYHAVDFKNLKVGASVFVKSLESVGEVLEINQNKGFAWVMVGNMKTKCKAEDILLVNGNKPVNSGVKVSVKRSLNTEVKTELNVIGLNVDEALLKVENFLDSAVVSNLNEVRIVHGKGLNILSSAIHNYLKGVKYVDAYRFGKYGEGEHGVTIVTFKE